MSLPVLSVILSPHTAPEHYVPLARAAEEAGLDEVWVWEDCFYESGIAAAGAILGATERITVGIGLLPLPLRAVSLTAMEIATLARIFPGRFLPGIGHGVQDWMGQAGVQVDSPLTLMREQAVALRALLAGEEVTTSGRYVTLDHVRLNWPPETAPPLLVGAVGPKTLALAGELGDGLILPAGEGAPPTRESIDIALAARAQAGIEGPFEVVAFAEIPWDAPLDEVRATIEALAEQGATRVPVFTLTSDGTPDRHDGIPTLMQTLAALTT